MSMSNTTVLISGTNQGLGFEIRKRLVREQSNYTSSWTQETCRKAKAQPNPSPTLLPVDPRDQCD